MNAMERCMFNNYKNFMLESVLIAKRYNHAHQDSLTYIYDVLREVMVL